MQQAFVAAGAVQCGFCTPGLLVAAHDLLARNPRPSDLEIREALAGNLCRCTGYGQIMAAVRLAATELAELAAAELAAAELAAELAAAAGRPRSRQAAGRAVRPAHRKGQHDVSGHHRVRRGHRERGTG